MIDIEDFITKKNSDNNSINSINFVKNKLIFEDDTKNVNNVNHINHANDANIYSNTLPVNSEFDLKKCILLLENLLKFIYLKKEILNNENKKTNISTYNIIKKSFEIELNKQIRLSKIPKLKKSILLNIFNNLTYENTFDKKYHQHFKLLKLLLRKKASRNLSGINEITIITAPFPNGQKYSCKHNCYYCPNEPAHAGNNFQAQPRSYLYYEPAVQRANRWDFNAIQQMFDRMDSLFNTGQTVDKLELIIEGGTFDEYPIDYLEIFHRDLFYAANIYFEFRQLFSNYDNSNNLDPNKIQQLRQPLSVTEEMAINKTAKAHIIGICIETRPDTIDDDSLKRYRKWGITRIQLGLQHVDNNILKKINRGHTIEKSIWAINYLKDNCFKIDIHIMPDLPGSTPEIDREMFDFIYKYVCPDQMKVYPCEIVPWTVIEKWYNEGKYKPYFDTNPKDLIDVVKYSMENCPNWMRLPRVIRDIPLSYVKCGNNIPNLREMIDKQLDEMGVVSNDIRFREIGRDRNLKYYDKKACYNIYYNYANNGHDYFICYESYDKKAIFGFIRLRILDKQNLNIFNILKNKGLIRELHIYGDTVAVDTDKNEDNNCVQHKGIGKNLLKIAEQKCMENHIYGIAIISGEGVKGYYEKNGYKEADTFMIKDFNFYKVWFYIILYYIKKLLLYLTIKSYY